MTSALSPMHYARRPTLVPLIILLLVACADGLVAVQPLKLARLKNSVYGAEQLLLFGMDGADGKVMGSLLSFDQGAGLESELNDGGGGFSGPLAAAGLAGKLLARQDFFEAAAERKYNPMSMMQMASGSSNIAAAMLSHLDEYGLTPVCCTLASAGEVDTVGMRDMGANTPAAPSSVRITSELSATLTCAKLVGESASKVLVPLGGAADAVLLARGLASTGGELPLLVDPALWELRAVTPERLPETVDETLVV